MKKRHLGERCVGVVGRVRVVGGVAGSQKLKVTCQFCKCISSKITTKQVSECRARVESAALHLSVQITPEGCERDAHQDRAEKLARSRLRRAQHAARLGEKQWLLISEELGERTGQRGGIVGPPPTDHM